MITIVVDNYKNIIRYYIEIITWYKYKNKLGDL